MTSLELTDKEKDLFMNWLTQRESTVSEELNLLKSLRSKIDKSQHVVKSTMTGTAHKYEAKTVRPDLEAKPDSLSWVDIIKNELRHFAHPVKSGEIVKRLLLKTTHQQKGKRFITKAVTSKLWLLQERGEVVKEKENGRFVYFLKKQ